MVMQHSVYPAVFWFRRAKLEPYHHMSTMCAALSKGDVKVTELVTSILQISLPVVTCYLSQKCRRVRFPRKACEACPFAPSPRLDRADDHPDAPNMEITKVGKSCTLQSRLQFFLPERTDPGDIPPQS